MLRCHPGIQGIDFVSGAGIYGVSNLDRFLYLIDPLTGQVTQVGPTFIPGGPFGAIPFSDGVMDLAYDADTGALVATVIPFFQDKLEILDRRNPPPFGGRLYRIDPSTGYSTLLNGNAPPMLGLAEGAVPELSTGVLVLWAIGALLLVRPFLK